MICGPVPQFNRYASNKTDNDKGGRIMANEINSTATQNKPLGIILG